MKKDDYTQNGMRNTDIDGMKAALVEARAAEAAGEVPIGAVVVCNGEIVAAAHNQREEKNDVSSHAELEALRLAGRKKGDWRLADCTLYVTLEPCPMCAGAILAARVGRVVYGAKDAVAGAMGSVLNLPRFPLGSRPTVVGGVLENECRGLLQSFFADKRRAK